MKHVQTAFTAHARFMQAVQKEMIDFEQREREFIKKDREERAAERQLPIGKSETGS